MSKNPYENLRVLKKFVKCECEKLKNSNQTFEDIYNIVFYRDAVMAETSVASSAGMQIKEYTYKEVRNTIESIAAAIALKTEKKGAFIGLSGQNSVEWLISFWAILMSGNKPFLVNLMQPAEASASMLKTIGAEFVLCTDKATEYDGIPFILYNELNENESNISKGVLGDFGNEIAITTSGTTLKEKICIYTGFEISQQIFNSWQALSWNNAIGRGYKGKIKTFAMLPLYHIFGLEATYLWLSFFGAILVFPENLAPETLLRTVRLHEVTHIFAVPLLWHTIEKTVLREVGKRDDKTQEKFNKGIKISLMLQNTFPKFGERIASKLFKEVREKVFGDSVKFCISGGSPLKESSMNLINALGYHLISGYGMSEIGIIMADFAKRPKEKVPVSVGKPFNSVQVRVDSQGIMLVKGDSICKRIIVGGSLTENEEWFNTGDVVSVSDEGKYYLQGRASDIVISENGENLNPDFAEKFFDLPGAKCFSVMGDENMEKLILVVQIPEGLARDDRELLEKNVKICEDKLPSVYKISKVYYTVDGVMEESDIKVSRTKVRRNIENGTIKLFESIEEVENEGFENDSELKKKLRSILAEALNLPEEKITNTGHFIKDLGGTSLDYFTVVSEIDEQLGVTLEFEETEFAYNLNDLERVIEEKLK